MEFKHFSVMLNETVDGLNIKDNGVYVDGTLGGGGHSYEILKRNDTITVIGIDQDIDALNAATKRLSEFGDRFVPVKSNFSDAKQILYDMGIEKINGVVLDLGVSSYQLDEGKRGFSYMHDAPLDMRMDKASAKDAYEVVNTYSKEQLMKIFFDYGEEKWSKRVADFIVKHRENKEIKTTGELVDIIKSAIPAGARAGGGHPAKRIFQAIRIEVNNELGILEESVKNFVDMLESGGRISVITFHSLEDRIIKKTFADLANGCTCPKNFPICICGNTPKVKLINNKPILPTKEELEKNSRSKSAKLRVAEKL